MRRVMHGARRVRDDDVATFAAPPIAANRIPYGVTIYVRSTGGFYMLDRNYKP